jgi:hypothetical protein
MSEKLKSCPFCGEAGYLRKAKFANKTSYRVLCQTPSCWGMTQECQTKKIAIERWNNRPLEDALRIEAERRALDKLTMAEARAEGATMAAEVFRSQRDAANDRAAQSQTRIAELEAVIRVYELGRDDDDMPGYY